MEAARELFDLVYGVIMALIGLAGMAFAGWSFFDGFSNDQPESRKRGIILLFVVVLSLVLMAGAKGIILGMVGL